MSNINRDDRTVSNIILVNCVNCGKKIKFVKKELVGLFLLFIIWPFISIFGLNAASIIYSLLFFCVGLYWIVSRPSKKFLCKECSGEKKDRK